MPLYCGWSRIYGLGGWRTSVVSDVLPIYWRDDQPPVKHASLYAPSASSGMPRDGLDCTVVHSVRAGGGGGLRTVEAAAQRSVYRDGGRASLLRRASPRCRVLRHVLSRPLKSRSCSAGAVYRTVQYSTVQYSTHRLLSGCSVLSSSTRTASGQSSGLATRGCPKHRPSTIDPRRPLLVLFSHANVNITSLTVHCERDAAWPRLVQYSPSPLEYGGSGAYSFRGGGASSGYSYSYAADAVFCQSKRFGSLVQSQMASSLNSFLVLAFQEALEST
jgi:hypothetical protein